MIRYTLSCENDHRFESWFQSADAFDTLQGAGHVNCAVCGSTKIAKSIMAPAVKTAATPAPADEDKLAALRKSVEENADYVGDNFASEARAIHDGDKPERQIYGEAKPDEARKLLEDGVPVLPLPFVPKRQTH